jgi:flagellar assembly protein FliH
VTQASIRKFTFDNDFDRPKPQAKPEPVVVVEPEPVAPPPPTFSEEEMAAAAAAARKKALAEGVAQGRAEAINQRDKQIGAALTAIGNNLAAIDKETRIGAEALTATAIELGLSIARKLFPELARRHGLAEVEAVVKECLERLKAEPRFLVRVAEEHAEELGQRIDEAAAAQGYEGRISVKADASVKPGDCRIEWAQGGLIRRGVDIWSGIEAALEQGIASMTNAAGASGLERAEDQRGN